MRGPDRSRSTDGVIPKPAQSEHRGEERGGHERETAATTAAARSAGAQTALDPAFHAAIVDGHASSELHRW